MTYEQATEELENAALSLGLARAALMATMNFGLGIEIAKQNYDVKLAALKHAAHAFVECKP